LPIASTRRRERSQEIAPGAGRWGIISVLAVFIRESRPALVEHAGQKNVVAQTNAKAPGRALSQINKEMVGFHDFLVLK
jgi:hypothetical protein